MLESLEYLVVSACENLEWLADLLRLSALSIICVQLDVKAVQIQGFCCLHALEYLEICKASIEKLSDLWYLKSLRRLNQEDCTELQGLDGPDELGGLIWLFTSGCKAIWKVARSVELEMAELSGSSCKGLMD